MTKVDLIAVIADKLKFSWGRAELLVDVVFGCMEQSMSRGEKIEIRANAAIGRGRLYFLRALNLFVELRAREWIQLAIKSAGDQYLSVRQQRRRMVNPRHRHVPRCCEHSSFGVV